MRRRYRFSALAAVALLAAPAWADDPKPAGPAEGPAAAAPAEPTPPPPAPAPVEITSFVDTYYSYYFNKPAGDAPLRNFDTKHNNFSLGLIEVAAEQKVTTENRLGFRVDADFGPTTELVHAAEPGGLEFLKNLEQAYGSYLFGKKLQIDVGKFVTSHGAEVIETKDNWNYSRGLLFALAIPYYHAGLRATFPVNEKVTLGGMLVNGWNNVVDNNSGKTWCADLTLKPSAKLTLVQNVMGGPEQKDNTHDKRLLSDTVLTVNATPKLSLMANYDYGKDRLAGEDVSWKGIALYARLAPSEKWALIPRFEFFDDTNGFMTGTAQKVKEFTITSEQKLGGKLLTRLEYRHDFSDNAFFTKDGRPSKNQDNVTFGLVYAFSRTF
jgi:hypothetical protein